MNEKGGINMNDTTNAAAAAGAAPEVVKEAAKRAEIVRGVIPLTLVYMIRFREGDAKEAEVAKKYGTTSGKVADIVKGRNFGYVDAEFKPTQEDVDKAVKWLKSVPGYDEAGTDAVVNEISKLAIASEADVTAFQAKRTASRKANPKAAAAEGNTGAAEPKAEKPKKAGGKADKTSATPATADDMKALLG